MIVSMRGDECLFMWGKASYDVISIPSLATPSFSSPIPSLPPSLDLSSSRSGMGASRRKSFQGNLYSPTNISTSSPFTLSYVFWLDLHFLLANLVSISSLRIRINSRVFTFNERIWVLNCWNSIKSQIFTSKNFWNYREMEGVHEIGKSKIFLISLQIRTTNLDDLNIDRFHNFDTEIMHRIKIKPIQM